MAVNLTEMEINASDIVYNMEMKLFKEDINFAQKVYDNRGVLTREIYTETIRNIIDTIIEAIEKFILKVKEFFRHFAVKRLRQIITIKDSGSKAIPDVDVEIYDPSVLKGMFDKFNDESRLKLFNYNVVDSNTLPEVELAVTELKDTDKKTMKLTQAIAAFKNILDDMEKLPVILYEFKLATRREVSAIKDKKLNKAGENANESTVKFAEYGLNMAKTLTPKILKIGNQLLIGYMFSIKAINDGFNKNKT
jgi:hypothetical protein